MPAALISLYLALGSSLSLEFGAVDAPEVAADVSAPSADVSAAVEVGPGGPETSPGSAAVAGPSAPAATSIPLEPMPAPSIAPAIVPAAAPAVEAAGEDTVRYPAELGSGPSTPAESGPPFYSDADFETLRGRYGLDPAAPSERKARWRCLVADPTCSFNVEINATSAYAFRFHQGTPASPQLYRWSSGRSQFDLWVNLAGVVESHGLRRFTKLSLGPKGGVIVSDSKNIWGNAGLAMRYWFGRGRFSPTIELSSALTYRLTTADSDTAGQIVSRRSPIGVTADIGFGLGGFGALILGGQFDSSLAREDITETARIYPSGMLFVGFRGNIIWGAPAAAAIGTTALSQRVTAPLRQ